MDTMRRSKSRERHLVRRLFVLAAAMGTMRRCARGQPPPRFEKGLACEARRLQRPRDQDASGETTADKETSEETEHSLDR
jgi:hypothetical protein